MKRKILEKIKRVLESDDRVIFAYLYGSFLTEENFQDIDIGIYTRNPEKILTDSAEIKIITSQELGISPDKIDVQIINKTDNLFYLRDVLSGTLLVDKDPDLRGDFIESYSMRYREAEGILDEAYS